MQSIRHKFVRTWIAATDVEKAAGRLGDQGGRRFAADRHGGMIRPRMRMPTDRGRMSVVIGQENLHIGDRYVSGSGLDKSVHRLQAGKSVGHADGVVGRAGMRATKVVIGM